jgi:hypothetical protein
MMRWNMQITGTLTMFANERAWLESQEDYYNALLKDVGISEKVYIGTAVHGGDYEVYVDRYVSRTTEWFLSFDDALAYCKVQYPEAEWDNLG